MHASRTRLPTSSSVASRAILYAHGALSSMAENRFARPAQQVAVYQDARAEALAERVQAFVRPDGNEHAIDVGSGAGALALALAPVVHDVVGVGLVAELP